ncbi:ribonuclease [Klebsiella phage CPRSA]|nr:ribonuclease [Klebsiella phage CPRSA]
MTPEWAARYKENEELRDFEFIPKDIENSIIEAYNTPKSGSKAKMERYFMDNKLSRMFEKN